MDWYMQDYIFGQVKLGICVNPPDILFLWHYVFFLHSIAKLCLALTATYLN